MTAEDIITKAMYKANVIAPGEPITASEADSAFQELNNMLDAWTTERQLIWAIQRQVFTLVAGQQSYKVGPGGDFNIPRPVRIERMSIVNLNNPNQPLELPMEVLTEAQWQQIPVKQVSSTLPQRVWDDGGFPWRTLSYWCIPSIQVDTVLYTWTALGSFTDLFTDYEFPPGYQDAMIWNLAYRVAGDYGPYMPPMVPPMAVESKARLKSFNTPTVDLLCDAALVNNPPGRQYNWITDSPIGPK